MCGKHGSTLPKVAPHEAMMQNAKGQKDKMAHVEECPHFHFFVFAKNTNEQHQSVPHIFLPQKHIKYAQIGVGMLKQQAK